MSKTQQGEMRAQAQALLLQTFGFQDFREGQYPVIERLASGGDALGIMPTGAGKSICFEIAALLRGGITLVISPLISLMKDQVASLLQAGVKAAYLNASLTPRQMTTALFRARQYQYKIIYVAPERLEAPDFISFAHSVDISLVAVDEAHCVSQWGQDFRPSYLKIKTFIEGLATRPPVGAFTATATEHVKDDIVRMLELKDPLTLITGYDRPNLFFAVERPKRKDDALFRILREREGKSGIIYCATRKAVEEVTHKLVADGYLATRYHAGLPDEERHRNQDDFIFDRRPIIVATNAFGMGIDKSNVSYVVHYNMPKDIESYYQEAGRAGRDGSPADCILLYAKQDVMTCQFLIEHSEDSAELSEEVREARLQKDRQRLRQMTFYATSKDCLRMFILKYFGEAGNRPCGHCGNCRTEFVEVDASGDASQILACVERLFAARRALGATRLIGVLRGTNAEKPLFSRFEHFGCLAAMKKDAVQALIDEMLSLGILSKSDGEYPIISKGETPLPRPFMQKLPKLERREAAAERTGAVDSLFKRLKAVRLNIARRENKPAYIIMTDASLVEMSVRRPLTLDEFALVSGVGQTRARKYGAIFIDEIRAYLDQDI